VNERFERLVEDLLGASGIDLADGVSVLAWAERQFGYSRGGDRFVGDLAAFAARAETAGVAFDPDGIDDVLGLKLHLKALRDGLRSSQHLPGPRPALPLAGGS
jgi:hypothetical protein